MKRGSISNKGKEIFWVMADVLFLDGVLLPSRVDWLDKVSHVIQLVVILKPEQALSGHPYDVSYKTFRSLTDAQRALKQDSRPVCIISKDVDDMANETWSFSENILSRYNISMR